MKVLFMGCHCDDIELGCGATIHKYINMGMDVYCHTFSSKSVWRGGKVDLTDCSRKALKSLGVKNIEYSNFPTNSFYEYRQLIWETINGLQSIINPDLVFTMEWDNQQDHEVLFKESIRNFRQTTMLSYKPTIRNAPNQHSNFYEKLSLDNVSAKQQALSYYHEIYKDVIYFQTKNIESILRIGGIYIEEEFAEEFNVIKMISD